MNFHFVNVSRLVANSSRLEHSWEAQFYAVLEHRTNSHQVRAVPKKHHA